MLGYISEALSQSIKQEDHVGGCEAKVALQEAGTRASDEVLLEKKLVRIIMAAPPPPPSYQAVGLDH